MSTGTPVVIMLHITLGGVALASRSIPLMHFPEHTTSKQQDVPLRLTVKSVSHISV